MLHYTKYVWWVLHNHSYATGGLAIGVEGKITSHFGAFISYSHADSGIAKKLHHALETYRLPKALRKLNSNESGRIGPIFRDREDLPAGNDLSESVKQALEKSSCLIILCSPDSQKSPWVAREITLFRELHPDKPILAAIIAGEPEQSFPKPLIEDGREPLAADLRKAGDGWKLGLLKLIAGIAGVPLDSLIQRDAQRKLKRVMAVTVFSSIALIAMIGMTLYAFQQRNEAQDQRIAAEGLIGFMLRDLRNELKGASTLRVRTKVNHRALQYYSDQGDLSALPDDSLGKRATILHALGEDDENRGDYEKARANFLAARRATEELLKRDPENADRIFEHAQSEYWVGRIYELRKQYSAAQKHYTQYDQYARKLHVIDKDSERALLERAFGANNLGILSYNHRRDTRKARAHFHSAVQWFQKADKLFPSDSTKSELANALAWLADTHYREENFKDSIAARHKENQLKSELLAAYPDNADLKMKLISSERAIALNEIQLGLKDAAQTRLRKAQREAKILYDLDNENTERRTLLGLINQNIEQTQQEE